jgi:hypothetical protein
MPLSQDPPDDPRVEGLYEELLKKAPEAGPEATCPICGNTGWIAFDDPVTVYPSSKPEDTGPPTAGWRALGLACGTCGFLRLHMTGALDI